MTTPTHDRAAELMLLGQIHGIVQGLRDGAGPLRVQLKNDHRCVAYSAEIHTGANRPASPPMARQGR